MKAQALAVSPPVILSPRKASIRDWADRFADQRDEWIAANRFYYEDDRRFMRFLIPEHLRVLELGCATRPFPEPEALTFRSRWRD